jgi:DNA-binding transcriptional MerR regulator
MSYYENRGAEKLGRGFHNLITGLLMGDPSAKAEVMADPEGFKAQMKAYTAMEEEAQASGNIKPVVSEALRTPEAGGMMQQAGVNLPPTLQNFLYSNQQYGVSPPMPMAQQPLGDVPLSGQDTRGTGYALNMPKRVNEAPAMPSTEAGWKARTMNDLQAGRSLSPTQRGLAQKMEVIQPNLLEAQQAWEAELMKIPRDKWPAYLEMNPPPISGPSEQSLMARGPATTAESISAETAWNDMTPEERTTHRKFGITPKRGLAERPNAPKLPTFSDVLALSKAIPTLTQQQLTAYQTKGTLPANMAEEQLRMYTEAQAAEKIKTSKVITPIESHARLLDLYEPASIEQRDINAGRTGDFAPGNKLVPKKAKSSGTADVNFAAKIASMVGRPQDTVAYVKAIEQGRFSELPLAEWVSVMQADKAISQELALLRNIRLNPKRAGTRAEYNAAMDRLFDLLKVEKGSSKRQFENFIGQALLPAYMKEQEKNVVNESDSVDEFFRSFRENR